MYRTCMFCKKPLGSNEVVEAFPVGRRLAFDPAKGHLWVVCRNCERWNLTRLEAAWREAEEIAAIADNLFLPEHTDEFLDRHKRRGGSGGASRSCVWLSQLA